MSEEVIDGWKIACEARGKYVITDDAGQRRGVFSGADTMALYLVCCMQQLDAIRAILMPKLEPMAISPLTEGTICKGGQNPPNPGLARPPAPKGSGG